MINAIPVPILTDNYVWILSNAEPGTAIVVDPGEEYPVITFLEESGLDCAAVLLTHHHGDHIGGAETIKERWKCPVYGPFDEKIPSVTHPVTDGDVLIAAGLTLEVLAVPGHTRGHVAYVGHGHLLCGDTLFAGGCGRIFEGTPKQMFESLGRLSRIDPDTRVCCAHEYTVANLRFAVNAEPGNSVLVDRLAAARATRAAGRSTLPSTIGEELATNPFLRCDQPEVVTVASHHAGRGLQPGLEVFAEVRGWKDNFR